MSWKHMPGVINMDAAFNLFIAAIAAIGALLFGTGLGIGWMVWG
jgi:hypothetical protein